MTSSSLSILAQAAGPGGAGGFFGSPLPMIILMFVMMYFIIIRPQRKKQKELENLHTSLKTGDHVVTIGGAHGIISSVKEKTIMVRLAESVKVEFDKSAVAHVTKKTDVVDVPAS